MAEGLADPVEVEVKISLVDSSSNQLTLRLCYVV